MAINKLRYYLGPLGYLQALPPMVGGQTYPDAPIRIPSNLHTSISGRTTQDRTGTPKRVWSLAWENLKETDRLPIDAAIHAGMGQTLRLIDPRSSNRLRPDASVGGSLFASSSEFTSSYVVTDACGATVSSSWGTTDTGEAWSVTGGTAAQHSKAGGVAKHAVNAVGSGFSDDLATVTVTDFVFTNSVATDKLATGAAQAASVYGRFNSGTGNKYMARIQFQTGGFLFLELIKTVSGVDTVLGSGLTTIAHVAGTQYNRKFQAAGTTIRFKVWKTTDPEPSAWNLSVIDSSIASGTFRVESVLFGGNTNTSPVTFSYDNFSIMGTPVLTYAAGNVPSALSGYVAGAQVWTPLFAQNLLTASYERVPVLAGSTYTFSCYALGTANVKLAARPYDVAGVEQAIALSGAQVLTGAFQRLSWVWTPSAGQVSANFALQAQAAGSVTTTGWQVVIDDAVTPIPWAFGVGCPAVVVDTDVPAQYWRAKYHRIRLTLRET
jgi:hypothetical protein